MRPHGILQSLQATAAHNWILSSSSFIDRLTLHHDMSVATGSVGKHLTEDTAALGQVLTTTLQRATQRLLQPRMACTLTEPKPEH
jgi:hypothetical protein